MGIKQKLLPPSSASFHYFESSAQDKLDLIAQKLEDMDLGWRKELNNAIATRMEPLEREIIENRAKIARLEQQLRVVNRRMDYYALALGRGAGEAEFEEKLRLFKNLPMADGKMRLCQLATAKMLKELVRILEENQIEYFLGYGALLGAMSRGGFIPWDDDVDIQLSRDNFEKLRKVLKGDSEYQITIAYDRFVHCVQYRFCAKNENIPTFVDLGVWDAASEYTIEKDERLKQLRRDLVTELEKANLPYWKEINFLWGSDSGWVCSGFTRLDEQDMKRAEAETWEIKRIFAKYQQRAYDEGIFVKETEAQAYAYGLDAMTVESRSVLIDKVAIFPTCELEFEGMVVKCPHDVRKFLAVAYDGCYEGWPVIPDEEAVLGERGHFDRKLLDNWEVKGALQEFLRG